MTTRPEAPASGLKGMQGSALGVALIGCGNVAINCHGPALEALEGAQIVAVVDPLEARRNDALQRFGLPAGAGFDSHSEMLREFEPDFAVVAAPPSIRRSIVEALLEAGVHVLSEKPLATRPSDGEELVARAAAEGLKFGMAHNYLFFPEYVAIREAIRAGAIGELRFVNLNFMGVPDFPGHPDYRPRWRHQPQEAGGGILMDMIHVIYVAEYLTGEPVRAVSAIIDNLGYPGDAVEDLALLQLHFPRAYGAVNLSWAQGPGGVEVSGSKGRILAFYEDFTTGPFSTLDQMVLVNEEGKRLLEMPQPRENLDTFTALHADFIRAIVDDRDPVARGEVGLRCLEAALAAYESAVTGRTVSLPLDRSDPVYLRGIDGLRELSGWEGSPTLSAGILGVGKEVRS